MTDELRELWDPIWEYLLNDYGVEEKKSKKRPERKKPEKEDKGFSEETRDEEYRDPKKAFQDDERAEPEERQDDKTIRRHAWWRNKDRNPGYPARGLVGGSKTEKKDPKMMKFRILKKESSDNAVTKNETIEKKRKGLRKNLFQRSFRKEKPQEVNTTAK
jgi:hypothetical protein